MKSIESKIAVVDINSMLVRPFLKQVFFYNFIEKQTFPGFAEQRVNAGKECQDCSMSEIYDKMDNRYRDAMQVEMPYFKQLTQLDPQIVKAIEQAKKDGKKVFGFVRNPYSMFDIQEILQKYNVSLTLINGSAHKTPSDIAS